MNEEALLRRRDRTHAIVEGALLGDIAIVFLLMRVYMPILVVRTLIRAVASVPFVLLTQRRGVRIAVLAGLASYILFSALVGPILALAAVDVAVAGILVGIGRKAGIGPVLNTLWTGPAYAFLDLVIPTIASVFIFRYPVKELVDSARHFVKLVFQFLIWVLHRANAPASAVHTVQGWEAPTVAHWQYAWLGSMALLGYLTIYLAVLIAELVMRQLPEETLDVRRAA